jgi:hypothetical protein
MRTLSSSDINSIFGLLQQKRYDYKYEYIGLICSGTDEGNDGMYHYVKLYGDDEGNKYVKHTISINNYTFYCHENEDSRREWYFGNELLPLDNDSCLKKLIDNLNSIITPFNFEQYAIESFDPDAIAEAVPFGHPHCLIIDNCTFIVENEEESIDVQKVRSILKEHNWTDKRINKAIEQGYEYTSDVFDALCDLPLVYVHS